MPCACLRRHVGIPDHAQSPFGQEYVGPARLRRKARAPAAKLQPFTVVADVLRKKTANKNTIIIIQNTRDKNTPKTNASPPKAVITTSAFAGRIPDKPALDINSEDAEANRTKATNVGTRSSPSQKNSPSSPRRPYLWMNFDTDTTGTSADDTNAVDTRAAYSTTTSANSATTSLGAAKASSNSSPQPIKFTRPRVSPNKDRKYWPSGLAGGEEAFRRPVRQKSGKRRKKKHAKGAHLKLTRTCALTHPPTHSHTHAFTSPSLRRWVSQSR